MPGALDRFFANIRSFLTGPEKKEEEAYPLHLMHDLEGEEESEEITLVEGAGFVVERKAEA